MPAGALGLTTEEFWSDPYRTRDAIEDDLLTRQEAKTIVGLPAIVPLDVRDTAPLVVLRVASNEARSHMPFRSNAIVTAVDLTRNQAYADLAIEPRRRMKQQPSDAMPAGWGGEAFVVDLRERLNLPWQPGQYLVTLLLQNEASPRLRTALVSSSGAQAIDVQPQLLLLNPPPGPRVPDDQTPPVPADVGIELVLPRTKQIDDSAPTLLRGSFRVPLRPHHRVVPGPDADRLFQQLGEGAPRPTAVVPMMVVATGSASPTPFVWQLVLPVFEEVDANSPIVGGTFVVDLDELANVRGVEQTLFVYAFSAEAMAGPVPVAFTREASRR